MKRGPKPTPTADLNSWRARAAERRNEIQVAKPKRPPACPKWLTGDARQYWNALAKGMHANGLLTAVDVLPFSLVCQLAADANSLDAEVGDRRLVVWESGERINPLIKARLETIRHMRALCNDMGMTPTSRIGLPQPEQAGDTKAGKVIAGRFPKG